MMVSLCGGDAAASAIPRGSLFMVMSDKYNWIRSGKAADEPVEAGRWLSFPGPGLGSGEPVTMEVDWGPDRTRLYANGVLLQEVPGTTRAGRLGLHVWGGDSAWFRDIGFRPREP